MSFWSVVTQQFVNAIMLGTIYSLIAIGFSLFFGTLDVIHFSHGDVFMVGAFVGLTLLPLTSAIPLLGVMGLLLLGALITGVIGIIFGRIAVTPLQQSPPLNTLLATLALGVSIREAVRLFYPGGTAAQRFEPIFPVGSLEWRGVIIRYEYFFIFGIGLLVFLLTHLLVTRTRLGMAIRAVSQDREAAMMMGVDLDRTIDLTFLIGSALAGIAGLMHGTYYSEIIFTMGLAGGLIGFSAAVIGGLGSIWGAVIGGYLFAFSQTIAAAFIPGGSEWQDVFAFFIVILFLLLRPSGILGEREAERV